LLRASLPVIVAGSGWRLHHLINKSLLDLYRMVNPIIRGWINYYSYYKFAFYGLLDQLKRFLKK
jgi:hypothetical protein